MTTIHILDTAHVAGRLPQHDGIEEGEVRSLLSCGLCRRESAEHSVQDVVRHLKYDVAELAIVTFLQAKAHGKPLVLLPALSSAACRTHFSSTTPNATGSRRPISMPAALAFALIR